MSEELTGEIPIDATGKNLKTIIELMELIEKTERTDDGDIIFLKFESAVREYIKNKELSLLTVIELLNISNHLDIEPLLNAFAYYVALWLSKTTIPEQNINDYLKKEFSLASEIRRSILNIKMIIALTQLVEKTECADDGNVIFIKLEPLMREFIKNKNLSLPTLIDLLNISNHFDIKPLLNALAYFVALRLSSKNTIFNTILAKIMTTPNNIISEDNIDEYLTEKLRLSPNIRRYVKKHFILIEAHFFRIYHCY